MKSFLFRNGDEFPAIGLGTWQLSPERLTESFVEATDIGYRMFDCAHVYGNEKYIGDAFREIFTNLKKIDRKEMFVTSKLWNDAHDEAHAKTALKNTLSDLRLDYLDLYLIHWPVAQRAGIKLPTKADDMIPLSQIPLSETWGVMEELKNEGLVRHIGVSNFSSADIEELMKTANTIPEMNQVESHPYLQQEALIDYCKANKILVTAYSPLGTHSLFEKIAAEPQIRAVCKKHSCTPAQAILSWNISRGVAVIPKTVTYARLKENFGALEVNLDDSDIDAIKELEKNFRVYNGSDFEFENGYYKASEIWR